LQNIEVLLTSLGYRSLTDEHQVYGKPVGYHILLFDIRTNTLSNHFFDKQGRFNCYDRTHIAGDTQEVIARCITTFEAYTKYHISPDRPDPAKHEFRFMTRQEQLELFLKEA